MVKFEKRYEYIGGSDFATVLDINPYKKRIELVLEKGQVITNNFEGNAATRRGEKLENTVINLFEQETGLKVTNKQKVYEKEPREGRMKLLCHVDGMTKDSQGNAVFEAKTTDINAKVWNNGIPEYYKAQLEFNMYLSQTNHSYIAVAFCNEDNIENFKYYLYTKQMNNEEIEKYCEIFTSDIEKYKQKGVICSGEIRKEQLDGDKIEKYKMICEQIEKIKKTINPLEKQKKLIEDEFKQKIGIDEGIEDDCYRISLGYRITSPKEDYSICRAGLKVQYKGE